MFDSAKYVEQIESPTCKWVMLAVKWMKLAEIAIMMVPIFEFLGIWQLTFQHIWRCHQIQAHSLLAQKEMVTGLIWKLESRFFLRAHLNRFFLPSVCCGTALLMLSLLLFCNYASSDGRAWTTFSFQNKSIHSFLISLNILRQEERTWKHSVWQLQQKRIRGKGSSRATVCFQAFNQHSSLALLWHFRDRIDLSRESVK